MNQLMKERLVRNWLKNYDGTQCMKHFNLILVLINKFPNPKITLFKSKLISIAWNKHWCTPVLSNEAVGYLFSWTYFAHYLRYICQKVDLKVYFSESQLKKWINVIQAWLQMFQISKIKKPFYRTTKRQTRHLQNLDFLKLTLLDKH